MSDSAVPAQVSAAGILWPQAFEPQEREVWERVCVWGVWELESTFEG